MNSRICKKKMPPLFRSTAIFLTRAQGQAKKLTSLYRLALDFSPNKSPNNGNQHCWKEVGDLDSFAPDEVDPNTENEAGADQ